MSRITEAFAKVTGAQPDQRQAAEPKPWDFGAAEPVKEGWDLGNLAAEKEPRIVPLPAPRLAPRAVIRPPAPAQTQAQSQARPIHPGRGYEERLIGDPSLPKPVVEQYRRLGAVLHRAQVEHGARSLMVASSVPAEGKTLVASNIALVLSRSYGRRVLLVDGDLRRPALHNAFGVENRGGIADRLGGQHAGPVAPLRLTDTLDLLVAGTVQSDPLRIVTGDAMRNLLRQAAADYDWVILDTPPIALMPDAHLLASMVDRVLLVIEAGRTPYDVIQKSIDTVGRDRIIGTVLNRADTGEGATYENEYADYYAGRS